MDLPINKLGLIDCAINGVINIYVVERKISLEIGDPEAGKDAIFANGSSWASEPVLLKLHMWVD